jgi:small subunit ribosomal protein S33
MSFRFRAVGKFTPAFAALVDETARNVFGHLPVVNYRTGFKYLKRKPMGDIITKHYIPDSGRQFRNVLYNYTTERQDIRKDQLMKLRVRGKGPPKKGHGKRAQKKK